MRLKSTTMYLKHTQSPKNSPTKTFQDK